MVLGTRSDCDTVQAQSREGRKAFSSAFSLLLGWYNLSITNPNPGDIIAQEMLPFYSILFQPPGSWQDCCWL